jgi:hypothetical protein
VILFTRSSLEFAPAAISFHMGVPVDLIAAAHEPGDRLAADRR